MSDLVVPPLPLFIHTYTRWAQAAEFSRMGGLGTPGSGTWVANQAMFIPFAIPWPYPVKRVFWINGSVLGNADFGIYTMSGNKVYSTGSTAQSGASAVQYVTPGTPFILMPGWYYFAWANNGTTNRGFASIPTAQNGRMSGLLTQATALPLPASATFAQYAGTCGVQFCGVTRTSSGF